MRDLERENKNKRKGTDAKEWGRKFTFLPTSRIIDVGEVDDDPSSPAAPLLSLFRRSLFNFFFISSELDYFLISPNVLSTSRRVGRLPRQFRREKDRFVTDNKCNLTSFGVSSIQLGILIEDSRRKFDAWVRLNRQRIQTYTSLLKAVRFCLADRITK